MLKPINKIHASVLKVLQIVKQVFGFGIMLCYGLLYVGCLCFVCKQDRIVILKGYFYILLLNTYSQ